MPKKKIKHTKATRQHIGKLHRLRLVWFAMLAVGVALFQFGSYAPTTPQTTTQVAQQKQPREILPYATNVSISGLASATNQARAANGLAALSTNSQLNQGAQAKAQHMIANNYWAHTAPDGTEPWFFFGQAGYNYSNAGENLAYGFDGSSEIVDAWMGSTGHRANILGDYKDMGFGFANGENYQGGEYTVVVAFYGTQQSSAPPPPPAPAPAPAPKSVAATTPKPEPETPTPAPVTEPEPVKEDEQEPTPTTELASTEPTAQPVAEKRVTNLQNILNGNAGWPMYASLGFISASMIGFVTTHIQLVRRGWQHAKHFILVHPALDTALLIALLATLLTATVGFIK